ncbi:MAG: flagellar protein FlaG [Proteobacteria bacterium]|nr:flagellar protein FlaG [Pseudomonadota bacterium]
MVDINAIRDINSVVAQSVSAAQPDDVKVKEKAPHNVKPVSKVTSDEIHIDNVDNETIEKITSDIGKVLSNLDVELQLVIDDDTKRVVVKVVDPVTKEVIKQIPSKEMLRIGRRVDKLLSSYSLDTNPSVSIFKDSNDTKVE